MASEHRYALKLIGIAAAAPAAVIIACATDITPVRPRARGGVRVCTPPPGRWGGGGHAARLAPTPRDANRAPLAGGTVPWRSATRAVATVRNSGLVCGGPPGAATITATSEGTSGTSSV